MKKKEKGNTKKNKRSIGLVPGTLIYTGGKKQNKTTIDFYKYNKSFYKKEKTEDISKVLSSLDKNHVNWINVNGIHKVDIIDKIGEYFSLHTLLLEDILTIDQLPKLEEYDECLFITLKMLFFNSDSFKIEHEHVSFILGKNFVLSFQEKKGDVFDLIRTRIEQDKGKIRKMGADYLFYLLIDTIVDNYYIILDKVEDQIDTVEEEITFDSYKTSLHDIISIRKELIFIKRAANPLRDAVRRLNSLESSFFDSSIIRYINDLLDHLNHIIQEIEIQRDIITGLIDLNNTNLNNKMNNVMKMLTVIATIFIPLTFIAGIYGMNFKFMPELEWKYGYPVALGIMSIIGVVMLIYMKKKKWF